MIFPELKSFTHDSKHAEMLPNDPGTYLDASSFIPRNFEKFKIFDFFGVMKKPILQWRFFKNEYLDTTNPFLDRS